MIVDASAIVAIIHAEGDADVLLDRLLAAPRRFTHPISVYEAVTASARLKLRDPDPQQTDVTAFLKATVISVVELGEAESTAALQAFFRYGRGRHPARLNMGDCFSYACAKVRGMPLLYKGDDFAKTDLA